LEQIKTFRTGKKSLETVVKSSVLFQIGFFVILEQIEKFPFGLKEQTETFHFDRKKWNKLKR
jgi:hypothetical protein